MGTRSLICVVKDKQYKLAQYNQWDGYPSGVGTEILDFLHNCDYPKFKQGIDQITLTKETLEALKGCKF